MTHCFQPRRQRRPGRNVAASICRAMLVSRYKYEARTPSFATSPVGRYRRPQRLARSARRK